MTKERPVPTLEEAARELVAATTDSCYVASSRRWRRAFEALKKALER